MDYFIRKLIDSFGIFFRTIRAFFNRRLMGLSSRLRQLTNFSRHATKVANASFQGAAAAVKKPTKREDYIETQRFFISKSFIIFLIIGIVLVGLFCYYVAWPFILSHFLTARFYVRDDRVEDWTGKVIVYSDKSKKTPMYSGRLEDGLLEGQGKEYDEDGLLTFEGAFIAGEKTGSGKSYEAGVLVYEGGFTQGKYQGTGTLYDNGLPLYQGQFVEGVYEGSGKLYSQGQLLYEGQFHAGVYEGSGTSYEAGEVAYKGSFSAGVPDGNGTMYEDGAKLYEGSFTEGKYNGEGRLFYPDGTLRYKGSFADGLYDGTGTEYREDGSAAYSGGYTEGKRDGSGTVTLENGDKIESEFTDGVGEGMIDWYKNGRLWYEGGASDITPDGFGTLYAESGKAIYKGSMDMGSIDGQWLLTLTADELREAFCDASVTTETDRSGGGFVITNEDLDLSVLCTYRSDDGESSAHRVWLFPQEGSVSGELIPWSTREEAESWASTDREGLIDLVRSKGGIYVPGGGVEGDWYQSVGYYESYNMSIVSQGEKSAPVGIVWALVGGVDVPDIPTVDQAVSETQEMLEGLLDALDKVTVEREPTPSAPGGENPGGENPGENPGGENPGGENPNENPGGENPGGGNPGETPGGDNPGGENPGENPGGENPGGENPSENPGGENPGENPGGDNPGGENPGENPGGDNPGGENPGENPGGDNPGGENPGENPGGDNPGGENPGENPGSENPGGENPGENPGGDNPGSENPGENPGEDNPGGENPSENPGGENPGGENPGENPGGETPGDNPGEDNPSDNPGSDNPGGENPEQPGGEGPGGGSSAPLADVEALLSSVKDLDQATTLMGALINSFAYGQAVTSLEAARPLRVKALEEQKEMRDKGLSTDDAVQQLQDSLDSLDHSLYQYNVMLEQARITVETLTGGSVDGMDLSNVLLTVNVSSVDVDALYSNALSYAKDLAAERYEVDPAEVLVDVKVKVLDLAIAYDNVEQGRATLTRNLETLDRVTASYSRGEAEKIDLYNAQCAVNDTVSSLFQTIASYTSTFNSLNNLSGGWMASQFDWFPAPFAPLKDASIAKAQEEAQKAADKAAEKAAELAKQQIEEEEKQKEAEDSGD